MIKYFKNSIKEIQKVTWPSKEDSLKLTIITLIFTALTTLGLTLVDQVFNAGYQTLVDLSPETINTEAPQFDLNAVDVQTAPVTGESTEVQINEAPDTETTETE